MSFGGQQPLAVPKKAGELATVPFDFTSKLAPGETISLATVTCTLYSGVDPNPSAMIFGVATIFGFVITQKITAGGVGNLYQLLCTITTSTGQSILMSMYLAVVPGLT